MINRLSLKWKIGLIGYIPLAAFVAMALWNLSLEYQRYQEADEARINMELVSAASKFVHASQIERGIAASYLNKSASRNDFDRQKSDVDDKKETLRQKLELAVVPEATKTEIMSELNKLSSLRNRITDSSGNGASSILAEYSAMISSILGLETVLANSTNLSEISSGLRTLAILEGAKENGGQLRATMTAVLAANKPINDATFFLIGKLKSGVDTSLNTPGMYIDKKAQSLIGSFEGSAEWKGVTDTYQAVLKRSDVGDYGFESGQFFSTITTALNYINDIVEAEHIYIKDTSLSIKDKAQKALITYSVLILFSTAALMFLNWYLIRSNTTVLDAIATKLMAGSHEVSSASGQIAASSTELAEAATEQAASLQETVSSINEISAMVNRNAESAEQSKQVSQESEDASRRGRQTVEEMLRAIDDISHSNVEIMEQMETSNREISDIVKVIAEIGDKTKVINDIVFQTKLLSFNASVEAARAGEHGKGFAVVAEEVGNLAQMSGNAAKEISDMLDVSIRKVEEIVDGTKGKINKLVSLGKDKVEVGKSTANQCNKALLEIAENVARVAGMVSEIATASNEQAQGIQEITKAMGQLDQATQQNTSVSQQSSGAAEQLKSQAIELDTVVNELLTLVHGANHIPKNSGSLGMREGAGHNGKGPSRVIPLHRPNASTNSRPLKKAAGQSESFPSSDDPRFEEF